MSMDVKNTGVWGFTYTRAYEGVEKNLVKDSKGGKKTGQMGCRIYDQAELNKAAQNTTKGNFLNAIKAKILLMVGKEIEYGGRKCIVGRTSFKEFIGRLNKADPDLKITERNFQDTMNKLSNMKVKITHDAGIDPQSVEEMSRQLSNNPEAKNDPIVRELSLSVTNLAKKPDDASSVEAVEKAVESAQQPERTITQQPAAARSQSKSDMSRPASPARSESSESSVRAGSDREIARKELAAMRTGKNAGHIEWSPRTNAKHALNEIFNQVKNDPVKKNEFLRKLEIAGFELNKKGDAVK